MFALIPLFTGLFLLSKSAQASTPTNYTTQKVSAPIPERKPIQISEFNIDLSGLFASFRRLFDFSAQNTTPNGNDLMFPVIALLCSNQQELFSTQTF